MDEITKGMEALVKMSKDMLDLSEEIKRDLLKLNGEDELEKEDDSDQWRQDQEDRDDFHASQAEHQLTNPNE